MYIFKIIVKLLLCFAWIKSINQSKLVDPYRSELFHKKTKLFFYLKIFFSRTQFKMSTDQKWSVDRSLGDTVFPWLKLKNILFVVCYLAQVFFHFVRFPTFYFKKNMNHEETTECVPDSDSEIEVIIFESILTTFEASRIFWGSWDSSGDWLEP